MKERTGEQRNEPTTRYSGKSNQRQVKKKDILETTASRFFRPPRQPRKDAIGLSCDRPTDLRPNYRQTNLTADQPTEHTPSRPPPCASAAASSCSSYSRDGTHKNFKKQTSHGKAMQGMIWPDKYRVRQGSEARQGIVGQGKTRPQVAQRKGKGKGKARQGEARPGHASRRRARASKRKTTNASSRKRQRQPTSRKRRRIPSSFPTSSLTPSLYVARPTLHHCHHPHHRNSSRQSSNPLQPRPRRRRKANEGREISRDETPGNGVQSLRGQRETRQARQRESGQRGHSHQAR